MATSNFDQNTQLVRRGMKLFGAWFLFCTLAGLGTLGVVSYVVYHLLQKVW